MEFENRAYPHNANQRLKSKNLKAGDRAYKVSDFEVLFVLVKVSGSKSWRFKYWIDGKEKLLAIGDYPAVSLSQARQARDTAKAKLAEGIYPNEAKQKTNGSNWRPKATRSKRSALRSLINNVSKANPKPRSTRPNIT